MHDVAMWGCSHEVQEDQEYQRLHNLGSASPKLLLYGKDSSFFEYTSESIKTLNRGDYLLPRACMCSRGYVIDVGVSLSTKFQFTIPHNISRRLLIEFASSYNH